MTRAGMMGAAMGKQSRRRSRAPGRVGALSFGNASAGSLYDSIVDGREYESIVGAFVGRPVNVQDELKKAIAEIEGVRGRPCLAYLGNVVKSEADAGIDASDDLPFAEMVRVVPPEVREVDILVSTYGGSGQQVSRFVNALRPRFDRVEILIPSFCMSAGTLFATSGNRIWMTASACLGPIDPQVPTKDGRFVPAQALLLLVGQLQRDGQDAMTRGENVPWTAVRIIDTMDKKELAEAITASRYSITMASEFLERYKFSDWVTRHTSGEPVTPEYRKQRAIELAIELSNHERWKNHGHAISRDVLEDEIRLKIDRPDAPLNRALVRAWALCHWFFDKTGLLKAIISSNYSYMKIRGGQK